MHQSMNSLLVVDMVVPKHVRVRHVSDRMSLVRPVHTRKLYGIPDEEDRQTVEHKILVSLLREKLHRPSSNVTHGISRTPLTTSRRDPRKQRRLLALPRQEIGVRDIGQIVQDFKLPPCTSGFGVNDSYGNAFAREMGKRLYELRVG